MLGLGMDGIAHMCILCVLRVRWVSDSRWVLETESSVRWGVYWSLLFSTGSGERYILGL